MADDLETVPPPAGAIEPVLAIERSVAAAEADAAVGRPLGLERIVAVITGASSAIGQAVALRFAREGADIALACQPDGWENGEEARRLAGRITAIGGRVLILPLDSSSEETVLSFFKAVERQLGVAHILVSYPGDDGMDGDAADFQALVKTALLGSFLGCRAFADRRIAAGGAGRIVVMTPAEDEGLSRLALDTVNGGLRALTRSLAAELGRFKINVNLVAPGLIRASGKGADADNLAPAFPAVPWNRAGEPEEVAELVFYLVSDGSDYVTGQCLGIDGGLALTGGRDA